MFAEFAQASENRQLALGVAQLERGIVKPKAELDEQALDAGSELSVEQPGVDRVAAIEREPDADRFSVPEAVGSQALQFVRRPVPEVERARTAELERVTAARDVLDMQTGAAPDHHPGGGGMEPRQIAGMLAQPVEEAGIADQRHLDGFRHARHAIALRQGAEELEVVDHGEGYRKATDEVLEAERIHTIFDADPGVILAEHRRR